MPLKIWTNPGAGAAARAAALRARNVGGQPLPRQGGQHEADLGELHQRDYAPACRGDSWCRKSNFNAPSCVFPRASTVINRVI